MKEMMEVKRMKVAMLKLRWENEIKKRIKLKWQNPSTVYIYILKITFIIIEK